MNVSVLGSGSWGTALAVLLAQSHQVTLWSFLAAEAEKISTDGENKEFLPGIAISDNIHVTNDMELALRNSMIVLATPSKFFRQTLKQAVPFIKGGSRKDFVNVAKGLEEKTLLRLSQVMEEELPDGMGISVLCGPSHAEEVSRLIPTAVAISSKDMALAKRMQTVFMTPEFRVYTNPDLVGVELGGALKNVIALAAGMSDGLGYGDNSKAGLMTRGIVEIARLGEAMGAKQSTFGGLTGIGDLIVTCTSMHSRNRRAGILLGQGKSLDEALEAVHMVVEGVITAQSAFELANRMGVSMPITQEINRVLFEGKDPRTAVNDLMTRSKTDEYREEDLY